MERSVIAGSIPVSQVGIGGHYKAMEEGAFEERFAYVEEEIAPRVVLLRQALAAGVTYFDTTWRNEVEMLGRVLETLGARDQVVVNGMVLGAFSGSKASGLSVEDYFSRWLDDRLARLPGGHFDTFMINAIEEDYDEAACARLVRLLQTRQAVGNFSVFGFSTHQPHHARRVADRFPEFRTIMLPYNYRNRVFEDAFEGYTGDASVIAMKPLVWAEYGLPFCAPNVLPDLAEIGGFPADAAAASRALRFCRQHPLIRTVVCAVNEPAEVATLIAGGSGPFTAEDDGKLACFNAFHEVDKGIPFFISGLLANNLRSNFFAASNLSAALGVPGPSVALNSHGAREAVLVHAYALRDTLAAQGFARYADLLECL